MHEKPQLHNEEKNDKESIDPTITSLLPPSNTLQPTKEVLDKSRRYPILKDSQGRRFVQLPQENSVEISNRLKGQMIISHMLKGIISSSDLVKVRRPILPHIPLLRRITKQVISSYVLPLDAIQHHTSVEEVRADLYILSEIFHDTDHFLSEDLERAYNTTYEDHNLLYNDGKVAYFDFSYACLNFLQETPPRAKNEPEKLRKVIAAKTEIVSTNKTVRDIVINKLNQFKTRFEGEDGLTHLKAIIAKAGKNAINDFNFSGLNDILPNFVTPELLQQTLIQRIDTELEKLSALNHEQSSKTAQ